MFRWVVAPLAVAGFVGCAEAPRITRASPEIGDAGVPLMSEVTFRLGRAFDASEAWVLWNHSRSNGRVPATLQVEGRDLLVTPLAAPPSGALQDVEVHGLRTLSGAEIPPVHTQFRTVYEIPSAAFAWSSSGTPSDGGYRCQMQPDGRPEECVHYHRGVGKDEQPATDDDIERTERFEYDGPLLTQVVSEELSGELSAIAYTYNEREIEATVSTVDPGPDELLDTPDDEVRMTSFSEFDEQGFLLATWSGDVGDDGVPGTRDDQRDDGIRYLTDELGQDLGFIEVIVTDEGRENEHRRWDRYVDPAGQFRGGEERRQGADGLWYTDDDTVEFTLRVGLDEHGRVSDTYSQDEEGVPISWVEQVIDESGRIARTTPRSAVKGAWPEDDSTIRWYHECDLQQGRRTACRMVAFRGADGTWFTDDDRIETSEEYTP